MALCCVSFPPMGAITDLWKSERGLIAVALIVAATVLTALSVLTPERWEQWSSFVKWIFITYTAGKTLTGAAVIMKSGGAEATAEAATPVAPIAVITPVAPAEPAPPTPPVAA
jgi:hypothetical protein